MTKSGRRSSGWTCPTYPDSGWTMRSSKGPPMSSATTSRGVWGVILSHPSSIIFGLRLKLKKTKIIVNVFCTSFRYHCCCLLSTIGIQLSKVSNNLECQSNLGLFLVNPDLNWTFLKLTARFWWCIVRLLDLLNRAQAPQICVFTQPLIYWVSRCTLKGRVGKRLVKNYSRGPGIYPWKR